MRQLPTQENRFPHQTMPHTDDEAMDLTLGESARDNEGSERGD